ncbi:MAG: hypothetical protein LBP65_01845 [Puniceicoccales bacterium]|jgi:hypothetical protein|nr:hypothetical protein [Puniceicoccales bacterium]
MVRDGEKSVVVREENQTALLEEAARRGISAVQLANEILAAYFSPNGEAKNCLAPLPKEDGAEEAHLGGVARADGEKLCLAPLSQRDGKIFQPNQPAGLREGWERDGEVCLAPLSQGDGQSPLPVPQTQPTQSDNRPVYKLTFNADKNFWTVGPYEAVVELVPVAELEGQIFPNALQVSIINRAGGNVRNGRCFVVTVDSNSYGGQLGEPDRYAKTFEEALANLERNKARAEKLAGGILDFSILLEENVIGLEFERRMHGKRRGANALKF